MRRRLVLFLGLSLVLPSIGFAMVSTTLAPANDSITRSTVFFAFGETNRCTGVVVAPRLVLTAAHCTSYPLSAYKVVFAADLTLTLQGREKPAIRTIVNIYRPPTLFKVDSLSDDLALVELNKDVPDGIDAVALPDAELEIGPGAQITAYGFGLQNKEGMLLPMLPNATNSRVPWEPVQLRIKTLAVSQPPVTTFKGIDLTYHRLFIEQSDGGICLGDSGGPVFLQRVDQPPILIGVNGATVGDLAVKPSTVPDGQAAKSGQLSPLCAANAYVTRADTMVGWIREVISAQEAKLLTSE